MSATTFFGPGFFCWDELGTRVFDRDDTTVWRLQRRS